MLVVIWHLWRHFVLLRGHFVLLRKDIRVDKISITNNKPFCREAEAAIERL